VRTCIISLLFLSISGFIGQAATTARFAYVVGCDATVDKLDTVEDRQLESYDLSRRTGDQQLVPIATGTLDGCLAYQAVYDPNKSVFYTIVPVELEPKVNGTKDYRILSFSIPNLRLAGAIPAGENLAQPPHLEIREREIVTAVRASKWAPSTELDLSQYAPAKRQIPNQILEATAGRVLLRLFTNSGELDIAVADRDAKTLVRLQNLPSSTAAPDIHLVPGGTGVLVDETTGSEHASSGKLALYEALTGKRVAEFADSAIDNLYFLAIAPTGKVIYHANKMYRFVNLGRTFGSEPVTRPFSSDYPGVFFADK
jgi:hypothetical protein